LSTPAATLELASRGPAETRHIGRALGRLLQAGDVLLLEGRFGAGKTVLTQGIALGLDVEGIVNSPSFTLVNEYRAGKQHGDAPIYHADLYRIQSVDEALDLGLDEYLAGRGIFIAEWPENVAEAWPEERLWIMLTVGAGSQRTIRLDARGRRYVEIVEQLGSAVGN
jgi:tRNA threonylcarbamoyladenosine biosynthesis protein TsaE